MLFNNPGNQPDCHIPFFINPGDNEADLIFLPGSAVIITAVGDGVDALDISLYGDVVDIRSLLEDIVGCLSRVRDGK